MDGRHCSSDAPRSSRSHRHPRRAARRRLRAAALAARARPVSPQAHRAPGLLGGGSSWEAVPCAARRRRMAHPELRTGARARTQGGAIPSRAATFGGASSRRTFGQRPRARLARTRRAVRRCALHAGRASLLARLGRLRQAALDLRADDAGTRVRLGPRRFPQGDRRGRAARRRGDFRAEGAARLGAAHAMVGPDTIAKFLFTSGSTGMPKAVINTQRMWCSNQKLAATMFAYFQDEPPVLVEWAPWHHTAAGNKGFGMVLYNGGAYYIDDGKPLPGAIETTVKNLREIAPTWYFNVPRGFEALLPYFHSDSDLRKNFFSRLKVLWFAAAPLPQRVFDEYNELAYRTCGETIPFLTGFGATETAPHAMGRMWPTDDVSNMGLPPPGVEAKLVPIEGKLEMRVKGPGITPGYWRQPQLTARAFDEEGYYRLGDSFVFADDKKPEAGLLFRGRIAEDFKLTSGTFVHVGPLRARFLEQFAPLARDVVITGEGRGEIGALIFLSRQAGREELEGRLAALARSSTGLSNRISRAMVQEEPPSLDAGEMTDKGSLNQRAVLAR